ncbi:MAG: hypothetical protein ACK46X_04175 [Candidatus Sericytochromatia bacterium]
MERRIPQVTTIDPVAERALFFLDLAIAEVTKTVPQATPQTGAKR